MGIVLHARQSLCQRLLPNNRSNDCYILTQDSLSTTQSIMWLYKVFQNGLIFVSLVAGLAVTGHMLYCRSTKCRNWFTVFATVVTGFFHMMICLFLLSLSELTGYNELPHGGEQGCVDYTPAANTANVIVLTLIALNVIKQNFSSPLKTACAIGIQILLSSTGFIILTMGRPDQPSDMRQTVFLTLGHKDTSHIDIFWSVCQKKISNEHFSLICEYGLIYIPIGVMVLIAWYKTYRRTGDIALIRMKVLDANCKRDVLSSTPCICTKLNTAFVAVLFYAFLVLFIGRPIMILYGHMTSGFYRDILPSLLQTVLYCFICSEYITLCYKLDNLRHRLKPVGSNTVMSV